MKNGDGGLGQFTASLTSGSAPSSAAPASSGNPSYIGVPDNYFYQPPGMQPTSRTNVPSTKLGHVMDAIAPGAFDPRLPMYQTGDEAALANLAPEDVWVLQRQMAAVGLIGPKQKFRRGDGADTVTINAFKKLMSYANHYGEDYVSALRRLASSPEGTALQHESGSAGDGGALGAPGFTGTKTRTDRSSHLTDPKSAQELADRTLEQYLGRKATKAEYQRYVAALNGAEKANPVVSTTTESYKDGEATGSTTTSTGGLDAAGVEQVGQDFIDNNAALKAEKNRFLTETDYFQAAMAALGSPQ